MKNCKRDITLNEQNSVEDMLIFERGLLRDYGAAASVNESKESRELFLSSVKEVAEDVWFLNDLVNSLENARD